MTATDASAVQGSAHALFVRFAVGESENHFDLVQSVTLELICLRDLGLVNRAELAQIHCFCRQVTQGQATVAIDLRSFVL